MVVPADAVICAYCKAPVSTGMAAVQATAGVLGGIGCLIWVGFILVVLFAVLLR